ERVLRRRLPRAHDRGGDRLLQLRRFVVGRADRVAPRRDDRPDLRRAHGPSRGTPGLFAPARLDPERDLLRELPPRARPDLVEAGREPAAAARRDARAAALAGPGLGARSRVHRSPRRGALSMERYCFRLRIKPGAEAEYDRRHDELW